jgi:hypothetical protein
VHGVALQKGVIFIITAVRTSNLTYVTYHFLFHIESLVVNVRIKSRKMITKQYTEYRPVTVAARSKA